MKGKYYVIITLLILIFYYFWNTGIEHSQCEIQRVGNCWLGIVYLDFPVLGLVWLFIYVMGNFQSSHVFINIMLTLILVYSVAILWLWSGGAYAWYLLTR